MRVLSAPGCPPVPRQDTHPRCHDTHRAASVGVALLLLTAPLLFHIPGAVEVASGGAHCQ